MKKFIAAALSLVFALSLLAGCGSSGGNNNTPADSPAKETAGTETPAENTGAAAPEDDTVYKLVVCSPQNDRAEAPFLAWLDKLTEESNGRLQFEVYTSNALYQQSEVISAMANGMCDLCNLSLSEESSTFPLNSNIISLPFMGMGFSNDWIYAQMLEEYPQLLEEYDNAGCVLIDYSYNPPFNLHFTTSDPITQPSDLNGLKIVTTNDSLSRFIANQGGAPVSQPITEWYNSLEKGVATGVVAHANNIYNFGIIELLKQDVIFGEGAGITTNLNAYLWAKGSWEKLPADLQELILSSADELHQNKNASQMENVELSDTACQENGNMITVLTPEQIEVWREAANDVIQDKIDEVESTTGAPFGEMYNRILELAAE